MRTIDKDAKRLIY